MGKKVTGASVKITKNVVKKQAIQGLNKVLRPKVYITDSPSFRTLVQHLTGNQTVVSSFEQAVDHVPPVTAGGESSSQPCSSDSFVDSAETCSQVLFSPDNQEAEHTSNTACLDSVIPEYMSMEQAVSRGYSDVESWLLGVDLCPLSEQELLNISIHDYEISAALMSALF